jgi:response regulator RpfG family c-di-GMP phosphodiesterase
MHGRATAGSSADKAAAASAGRRVLVVDDEESVRNLLARWLESAGHAVVTATGAEAALAVIQQVAPAVVVCDIRMPGRDGLWLAERIRDGFQQTAVIMASGVQDVDASIACLRCGVVDYLTKPFDRDRLRDAVRRGLEWNLAACEAHEWRRLLEAEMSTRRQSLLEIVGTTSVDDDAAVEMLLAVAAPDADGNAHARRVRTLACALATELGLPAAEVEVLGRAALLHDIGKRAVPDAVLRKPAALTADEYAIVRRFPAVGLELLSQVPFLRSAAVIVGDSQERMDGHGYPRAVRAATVSLSARILCAADAFDTITHPRIFRDAMTPPHALAEMARCQGAHFDPEVVTALRMLLTDKRS